MQLQHLKLAIGGIWVLLAVVAGVVASVSTVVGLIALAALGLVPPMLMFMWWNDPAQTMSESINQQRR